MGPFNSRTFRRGEVLPDSRLPGNVTHQISTTQNVALAVICAGAFWRHLHLFISMAIGCVVLGPIVQVKMQVLQVKMTAVKKAVANRNCACLPWFGSSFATVV